MPASKPIFELLLRVPVLAGVAVATALDVVALCEDIELRGDVEPDEEVTEDEFVGRTVELVGIDGAAAELDEELD
jgi:hypothetical protein